MADGITSLAKLTYNYTNDAGANCNILVRSTFNGNPATGLTTPPTAATSQIHPHFCRTLFIQTTDLNNTQHFRRRKVYFQAAQLAAVYGATFTGDNSTWIPKGHRGERTIGHQ
jgi:hypothetical protein